MNIFTRTFDFLSYEAYLFVDSSRRQKTLFSAIISFLVIVSIIVLSVMFINDSLEGKRPNIIVNLNEDYYPNMNLSDYPFMMSLFNGTNFLFDPTIAELKVLMVYYSNDKLENGTLVPKLNFNEIPLTPCDSVDLGKYGYIMNDTVITSKLCIEPGKNNLTISGIYADSAAGFTYMNIFVNKCTNSTTSNIVCKPLDVINSILTSAQLILDHPSYKVNHGAKNPFVIKSVHDQFPISPNLFRRTYLDIMNVLYNTDVGLVFEDQSIENQFVVQSYETTYDLKLGAFIYPSCFAQLTYRISKQTQVYNRSYDKLQTILARIGGVLSAIKFMGSILVGWVTKKVFLKNLVDKALNIISFKLNNPQEPKIQNFLKDSSISVLTHLDNLPIGSKLKKELTFMQILYPKRCLNKDVSKLRKEYEKKENFVIERLSYQTLLKYFNIIDNILAVTLDDDQKKKISKILPVYYQEDLDENRSVKLNPIDNSSPS